MGKHSAPTMSTPSGSIKINPLVQPSHPLITPSHSTMPQTRSPASNLHPVQFKRQSNEYEGKRRKTPDGTVGKDMGYSIGPAKKPEYLGAHRAEPGRGRHAKTYDANSEINNANLKQNPTGKHRTEPGKGKHAKYYNPDRDIATSMNKEHPKNQYVGKHSARYKPEKNRSVNMSKVHALAHEVESIVSRHEGKNAARLRAMEKAA